jgi:ribosomal protein L16 Arg81 hydroxylase
MKIDFQQTPSHFISQHQEKKPLLIKSAFSPERFTWQEANGIFERSAVESKDFKLSWNGIRPKQEYVESYLDVGTVRHRLIKPVVYDYLKQGATLITNKIVREPMVDMLARQVACFTGRQTVSSLYAAFGEMDSFRAHWDTRDVFAIQLIGRKRWIVYEPSFDSPLHMQQSKDVESDYPCPEEPYMDFILEAGDIFYLPRGWWHNPLPLGEETLHLAVGTFPAFAMDFVTWVIKQAPAFRDARMSLNAWADDQPVLSSLATSIGDLLKDKGNYQRFMDEYIGALRVDTPLAIDRFGSPSADMLADSALIRLGSSGLHGIADNYIVANGARLSLDVTGVRLINLIAESAPMTVSKIKASMHEVDADKLHQLVQDLCRQDVLELMRS